MLLEEDGFVGANVLPLVRPKNIQFFLSCNHYLPPRHESHDLLPQLQFVDRQQLPVFLVEEAEEVVIRQEEDLVLEEGQTADAADLVLSFVFFALEREQGTGEPRDGENEQKRRGSDHGNIMNKFHEVLCPNH
jgi:hypothetical protein